MIHVVKYLDRFYVPRLILTPVNDLAMFACEKHGVAIPLSGVRSVDVRIHPLPRYTLTLTPRKAPRHAPPPALCLISHRSTRSISSARFRIKACLHWHEEDTRY